ncbi:MAG TPA: site-specific DNA-methyltransferase [Anaerolineaceae bacterium]|nr:site-specific DNA-methyltransferase [Anaerolineaceae bacterium]
MSFNTKLTDLLKTNPNFVDDEGELLLAAVQDRAWKLDHELIRLLLSDAELKAKFFDEIDGSLLFNTRTFIEYISQKNFLDSSYTHFRNRIGLTIDGKYLSERGEVNLVWAYKDCVLEGGQTNEEEKRKEIFFNEVLAQDEINRMLDPKVLTNFTRYTTAGTQPVTEIKRDENGVIRENLIIKGNNLIALYTLKDQFRGKVKLIYIDPPYNTGNDSFGYNDNFNHSTWLTFMKNRLDISRELLHPTGSIIISIDNKELAYLQILLDDIFGKENNKNLITVKRSSVSGAKVINRGVVNLSEYVVIYSKNPNLWQPNRVHKPKPRDKRYNSFIMNREEDPSSWLYCSVLEAFANQLNIKKSELKNHLGYRYESSLEDFYFQNANRIIQFVSLDEKSVGANIVALKRLSEKEKTKTFYLQRENHLDYYLHHGKAVLFFEDRLREIDGKKVFGEPISDIWDDILPNDLHNEGGVSLRKGKKSEKLFQRIFQLSLTQGDIVLDYFLGSGSSCAVAHKMGYQYIGIEQLDYGKNDSVKRIVNVINDNDPSGISKNVNWQGGGEFISCELMKYNQAFLDRIKDAENSSDLLQIWQEMAENSFLNWYVNPKLPEDAIRTFIEIGKEENGVVKQKKLLMELLDKNQLYVNLSEIDDAKFSVSDEDKALNKAFYGEN